MLSGKKQRRPRGPLVGLLVSVGGVGAFPRLDRSGDVGEPPAGPSESVEGLRRFPGCQLRIERIACTDPVSVAQGLPPGGRMLRSRLAGHDPIIALPHGWSEWLIEASADGGRGGSDERRPGRGHRIPFAAGLRSMAVEVLKNVDRSDDSVASPGSCYRRGRSAAIRPPGRCAERHPGVGSGSRTRLERRRRAPIPARDLDRSARPLSGPDPRAGGGRRGRVTPESLPGTSPSHHRSLPASWPSSGPCATARPSPRSAFGGARPPSPTAIGC